MRPPRKLANSLLGYSSMSPCGSRPSAPMPEYQRLQTIPGIGPLSATALIAALGDVTQCKPGRQLAAWLGLVPRAHSTGGTPRLLGIRTVYTHCTRTPRAFGKHHHCPSYSSAAWASFAHTAGAPSREPDRADCRAS